MEQKISFVVTVYNIEAYLAQCVESLLGQTYGDLEVILVNDGSTDGSLDLCRHYQQADTRVIVIDQQNGGVSLARNAGIKAAQGEWICFVDGDDWLETDALSRLKKELEQNYDLIIYAYYTASSSKKSPVLGKEDRIEFGKDDFPELQIATLNRFGRFGYGTNYLEPVFVWNKCYRRSLLEEKHLCFAPDLGHGEDALFALQVYDHAGSGVFVNLPLYNYREREDSITHRFQPKMAEQFRPLNCYLKEFVSPKRSKRLYQAYYERVAMHLGTCVIQNFCNPQNKKPYKVRKREFLEVWRQEPYQTSMERVNWRNFILKWGVLIFAMKYRLFILCEVIFKTADMAWTILGKFKEKAKRGTS